MPRVYFALTRHGDYRQPDGVPSAHLPYPLTEQGMAQVHLLIEDTLGFARDRDCAIAPDIDSSPLLRAWQTATVAARRMTEDFGFMTRVTEHVALTERCLGAMANLTSAAIVQALSQDPRIEPPPTDWKSRSDYRLPALGAESLLAAGERVAEHLTQTALLLSSTVRRDTLKVIVGHGGSIRHAAMQLGVLKPDEVSRLSMFHCRPVFLEWSDPEGFRHVAGRWKVRGEQLD